jgi:hypothetical protein
MKRFILVSVLLLSMSSSALALECQNVQEFNWDTFNEMKETLFATFPFSCIQFGYDVFDQLSSVPATSPATMEIHIIGMDLQPLAFLDSGFFDYLFQAIRICVLVLMAVGIVKHMMEVVL